MAERGIREADARVLFPGCRALNWQRAIRNGAECLSSMCWAVSGRGGGGALIQTLPPALPPDLQDMRK